MLVNNDPIITFGKHKGKKVSEVPIGYARWLAMQKHMFSDGNEFEIDKEIADAAAERINKSYEKQRLMGMSSDQTEYIVQFQVGEKVKHKRYEDFGDAFRFTVDKSKTQRDDVRILVWEVLPGGHKKCVMRYSGVDWAKDDDEFIVENYSSDDWED